MIDVKTGRPPTRGRKRRFASGGRHGVGDLCGVYVMAPVAHHAAAGGWRGGRGFTLIELLVVIAIISTLMAILLPSLARAREQGKKAKCLSNLRQIGYAMRSYFNETNDWFPFEKRNQAGMHGFYYGGHPGRRYPELPGEWWGYFYAMYRDTPAGRPFNAYLYPDLPDYDVPPEDPLFEIVRNVPVFECPSDTGGFWMGQAAGYETSNSNYRFTGSSYTCNYHFAWCWAKDCFTNDSPPRWLQRANAFLRMQMMRHSAEFVILFEDPFDSSQWNRVPRRGWHREPNRHNFLFLDGHAAYTYADTTQGSRGLGWKTASGNAAGDPRAWWNDPRDPDYQYRDIVPLSGW